MKMFTQGAHWEYDLSQGIDEAVETYLKIQGTDAKCRNHGNARKQ